MKHLVAGDLAWLVEDNHFPNPSHRKAFQTECADRPCRIVKIYESEDGTMRAHIFWNIRNQMDISRTRVVYMANIPLTALMPIE